MAEKRTAAPESTNQPRDYLVLVPFKFLGKWHQKDKVLPLKPSQAEYFVHQKKLKLKQEGAK